MSSSIPPFGRHRAEQSSERAISRSATQEALRPSHSGDFGVTLPLYSTGLQSADHLSSRDLFCPASLSDERTSAGAGFRAGVSIRESLTHDGADRGGAAPALRARPERGEWGLIGRDGGASRRVLKPDLEVPCGPRLPGGNIAVLAFVTKQT